MPTQADAEYVLVLLPPIGTDAFGTTMVPDTVVYPVPMYLSTQLTDQHETICGAQTNQNSPSPVLRVLGMSLVAD